MLAFVSASQGIKLTLTSKHSFFFLKLVRNPHNYSSSVFDHVSEKQKALYLANGVLLAA